MKKRIGYVIVILVIIVAGVLSRKVNTIPLWIGDALYATMAYFIIRSIWIRKSRVFIAICALSVCFLIELSQLCQAPWINGVRSTLPGRLILGRGFLWSDLIAYAAGVLAGFILEMTLLRRLTENR